MKEIFEAIFKAYDVRGTYPEQLNPDTARLIAKGFVQHLRDHYGHLRQGIAVGRDMRPSSPQVSRAFVEAAIEEGVDVINLGMVGTDMLYFAVGKLGLDGGVMITASHNPPNYNGIKFVRRDAVPVSEDSGLIQIRDYAAAGHFRPSRERGELIRRHVYQDYAKHVRSFINPELIRPLKVVMDGSSGMAGPIAKYVFEGLPLKVKQLCFEPDGTFPIHQANPMEQANRKLIVETVRQTKADLGVIWDGDADRCFFIDEKGKFVSGYYITALFIDTILARHPGETIVYDPRLIWANEEVVRKRGGKSVISKSGHSFIKECMRRVNAIFGGESSAHYYFRQNYYCDNGMIPVLLMLQIMSEQAKPLSRLVGAFERAYPISGEINSQVTNQAAKLRELKRRYRDGKHGEVDGLSVAYPDWRFNVRPSNTEPLLRLNVETRGDRKLLKEKSKELLEVIRG